MARPGTARRGWRGFALLGIRGLLGTATLGWPGTARPVRSPRGWAGTAWRGFPGQAPQGGHGPPNDWWGSDEGHGRLRLRRLGRHGRATSARLARHPRLRFAHLGNAGRGWLGRARQRLATPVLTWRGATGSPSLRLAPTARLRKGWLARRRLARQPTLRQERPGWLREATPASLGTTGLARLRSAFVAWPVPAGWPKGRAGPPGTVPPLRDDAATRRPPRRSRHPAASPGRRTARRRT